MDNTLRVGDRTDIWLTGAMRHELSTASRLEESRRTHLSHGGEFENTRATFQR